MMNEFPFPEALRAGLSAISQAPPGRQLEFLEKAFSQAGIEVILETVEQSNISARSGSLRHHGKTIGLLQSAASAPLKVGELELLAQLWSRALLEVETHFSAQVGTLLTQGDLEAALVLLSSFLGVQAAGMFWRRAGHWQEIAQGGKPDLDVVAWLEARKPEGQAIFQNEPNLVLQPLQPRQCDRCLVLVGKQGTATSLMEDTISQWTRRDQVQLAAIAPIFALALERISTSSLLTTLIELEQMLLEQRLNDLYSHVLQVAVREVPGSEAGSLLVYEDGSFGYRAVAGYSQELLQICYHPEDVRDIWYGLGNEAWQRNQPRLMIRDQDNIEATSRRYASDLVDRVGKLGDIQANLCIPVSYQGQFLAYLNLDSLSNPAAFDSESIETARVFGSHVALILQRARLRGELETQAQTDALSGLANRRAFQLQMAKVLADCQHGQSQTALALIDLDGFKRINDSLGHAAGDLVLRDVAQALAAVAAPNHALFRWGGDEFALILPESDRDQAYGALLAYRAALAQASPDGFALTASVGVAVYPEDGTTLEALFQRADAEMYQEKLSRNPPDTPLG